MTITVQSADYNSAANCQLSTVNCQLKKWIYSITLEEKHQK